MDDDTVDITELNSELFEAGDDFIGNSVANLRIFNVKKDVAEHST